MRKLKLEFRSIDLDGNGMVDKQEMMSFLAQKGVSEDHRKEIVDELFSKCDQDKNGDIEIDEFVAHYVDTKNQLVRTNESNTQEILLLYQDVTRLKALLQQARIAKV